jgi:hypothetical protein
VGKWADFAVYGNTDASVLEWRLGVTYVAGALRKLESDSDAAS